MTVLNEKEVNGFMIREKELVIKDDGVRLMPVDEEDRYSSTVMVKLYEPSEKKVTKVFVEVEGQEEVLPGFTFAKACQWAEECPQDLANLIFD